MQAGRASGIVTAPTPGQRQLTVAPVVALLLWLALWSEMTEPAGAVLSPLWVVALLWLPWLPVLPLLFRGRRKGCAWGSIVSVFYVGMSLTELIANPGAQLWAAGALGLSCVVMVILIRCARRWPAETAGPG